MYLKYGKRMLDLFVASVLICFALPVMLVLVIMLFYVNNGKPFFFQHRPGKNGKIFLLWKFRTMNEARDKNGKLLPDKVRVTRVGKFVRKTSMDELLQLFNVFKGEMSLVGPRPLLVEYLPLYNSKQMRRHSVLPGITGLAQVRGRNSLEWEKKFELDVWYVDHLSLMLDLKICFLTIKKLLVAEHIHMQGHATMPLFEGNKM